MPVRYCTVDDVKNVAKPFSQIFERPDAALQQAMETAISEASNMADLLLQSRYTIADIVALGVGNYPESIRDFVKIKAAMILLIQEGLVTMGSEPIQQLVNNLSARVKFYKKIFKFGNVFGVEAEDNVSSALTNSTEDLCALYDGGVRGGRVPF